jgi:hypothetical protein
VIRTAFASVTVLALSLLLPQPAGSQSASPRADATRVDLTGAFAHSGVVMGSVSGELAGTGDSNSGGGWSVGGGINLTRWSAVVGNYTIFNFRDTGSPSQSAMEQTEVGVRLRVGGVRTPAIFYVEGGGAMQRTSLSSSRVLGESTPGVGETVDVSGWAGWFGPGLQVFLGRRFAGEVSVAWEWGDLGHARVQGSKLSIDPAIQLTTLRLRLGMSAVVF